MSRFVLASMLTLTACGPDAPDADDVAGVLDTTAMAATIRARADGFAATVAGGNVDSVLSYVTADIVLLEPGIDVKGREAFRALLGDLWKAYKITSFTMSPEARTYGPDLVTEFGRYREGYKDSTGTELTCDCVFLEGDVHRASHPADELGERTAFGGQNGPGDHRPGLRPDRGG